MRKIEGWLEDLMGASGFYWWEEKSLGKRNKKCFLWFGGENMGTGG